MSYTRDMIKFRKSVDGRVAQLPNGGKVVDYYDHRERFAWYSPDLRFARWDQSGATVATGPTLESVLPDLADDAPVEHLRQAGKRLEKARAEQAQAMNDVYAATPAAVAAGVSEVKAAHIAGVDRMTVRRALGKL